MLRRAACPVDSAPSMLIAEPMRSRRPQPRFLAAGDTALVVEFGDRVDRT